MKPMAEILLVGEVYVDYTLTAKELEPKMRLGGIVHAARGLWACNIKYSVAFICPSYLVCEVKKYLFAHGCDELFWIGDVIGSPNIVLINDVKEVGHQGYDDILRDSKKVILKDIKDDLLSYKKIIIFPGSYDLNGIYGFFNEDSIFYFDIAYGVSSFDDIVKYYNKINSIIISTSSDFFKIVYNSDFLLLKNSCVDLNANYLLFKENRGGSRLIDLQADNEEKVAATLGETVNSVGVGDVYTAVMVGFSELGIVEAVWRGAQAATRYAQTTFPDDFKRDVQRDLKLNLETIRALGGSLLPWQERKEYSIYLAAPDFSYINKPEIDLAISALEYHNFNLRRPIIENGEVSGRKDIISLNLYFTKDLNLLAECHVVFAIPIDKDPGTLVEIGMAIQSGKPVITYDPRNENRNTMVMCGSKVFSNNLDVCLNGLFSCISDLRKQ